MANKSTLLQLVKQNSNRLLTAAIPLHGIYIFNHTPISTDQTQSSAAGPHRQKRYGEPVLMKCLLKQYFLILPYILTQNRRIWIYFLSANRLPVLQLTYLVRLIWVDRTNFAHLRRRHLNCQHRPLCQYLLDKAAALVSIVFVTQTLERSGT